MQRYMNESENLDMPKNLKKNLLAEETNVVSRF